MQTYRPDYDRQLILNNVRSDIKGELEAVILYEQHWNEIPIQDVRDVYYEVIKVEKEHTEELTRVLLKYDEDKYNGLK
jgi:rubrerythrin